MWIKSYRDYLSNEPIIEEQVEPSNGVIGCEMHDVNGWGNEFQVFAKKRRGPVTRFLHRLFDVDKPK